MKPATFHDIHALPISFLNVFLLVFILIMCRAELTALKSSSAKHRCEGNGNFWIMTRKPVYCLTFCCERIAGLEIRSTSCPKQRMKNLPSITWLGNNDPSKKKNSFSFGQISLVMKFDQTKITSDVLSNTENHVARLTAKYWQLD